MVSDSGPSPKHSAVWVTVRVLDENDNKPVFPEKVYQVKLPERERRKKAEPIYRVFAYDRDEGPNGDLSYSITDGNEDAKFFIDPKTAVLSSRKAFAAGTYNILTVCDLCRCTPDFTSVLLIRNLFFPCLLFRSCSHARSKQRTTADLRSPPRLACTSSGSGGLSRLSRCCSISLSTTSRSWSMTKCPRSWAWCRCGGAPPPSGLTSQVSRPADAGGWGFSFSKCHINVKENCTFFSNLFCPKTHDI